MVDFLFYLRFWLFACLIIGLFTGLFLRLTPPSGTFARWLGWTGLAALAGSIALALDAVQGPTVFYLTSALAFYVLALSGAAVGTLLRYGDLRAHDGWAAGLAPATLIWLGTVFFVTPAYQAAPHQEEAKFVESSKKEPLDLALTPPQQAISKNLAPEITSDLQACQEAIHSVINKENIDFHFRSVKINRRMAFGLDKISVRMDHCHNRTIEIQAFGDTLKKNQANQFLAQQRADAVTRYLQRADAHDVQFVAHQGNSESALSDEDLIKKLRSVNFIVK